MISHTLRLAALIAHFSWGLSGRRHQAWQGAEWRRIYPRELEHLG